MVVDSFAKKLALLLEQGYLPDSRLGSRDRLRLQSLYDAEVLLTERSGAGKRCVLRDKIAFEAFIAKKYPSGLQGIDEEPPSRSKAIAELRDSKKNKQTQPVALLLRGFNDSSLHFENQVLPIADWSEMAGVAALRLDEKTSWGFSGRVALVENLEVFWNFEQLKIEADVAIYAQGRLNNRVLAWLSSPAMQQSRIIHCGDYDPVGLDEFVRLKAACPGRAAMYVPQNLEALLSTYGKKELINDSAAILERLRKNEDPQVNFVVALMDRWGVGLEQEVLLLNLPVKNTP